jgi:hypothetical protein
MATEVTFQLGTNEYTGSEACTIGTFDKNANQLDPLQLRLGDGGRFIILYFNISSIPSNATINSASLSLNVYEEYNSTPTNVACGYIKDPDKTGGWDDTTDKATYNKKKSTSDVKWEAASTDIYDVLSSAVNTIDISTTGWKSFDIKTVVQSWVSGTYPNAGLWVKEVNTSNARIRSNQYATASDRPKLVVTYEEEESVLSLKYQVFCS